MMSDAQRADEARCAIGIDVGATNVRAGLVRRDGHILALHRERVAASIIDGYPEILAQMVRLIGRLLNDPEAQGRGLAGVGVGTGGQVNRQGAIIGHNGPRDPTFAPIPLRAMLAAQVELPVWIENDSKAAAWGEYCYGAGRGTQHMVCLTVGTGIGGGIVAGGRLFHGARGLAGHMGFISVNLHGHEHISGAVGPVEHYASGTGIAQAAQEALRAGGVSDLLAMTGGRIDQVTSDLVFDAAEQGDTLAHEVIRQAGYAVGVAVATLVHVLDPEVVVIGGGVAERGDLFLGPVRAAVTMHTLWNHSQIPVKAAELGNLAGVVGAAALCYPAEPASSL